MRTLTELNGRPASESDRKALSGAASSGEFGGVLHTVFSPESTARFEWAETRSLNGVPVQVFEYKVDPAHSAFTVAGADGKEFPVGFHGSVFIDAATRRTRRVTLQADGLPQGLTTRSTSLTVDYDFVPIEGLRYLMPVSAELRLEKAPHEVLINTIEFTDFRRVTN